jgi:hypothetical protein
MHNVFRYVEPSGNPGAYGHEIRQLLILGCTEVEAQCKAVLRANSYQKRVRNGTTVGEDRWNIKDYFKVARPLLLSGHKLKVRGHPDLPVLDPFERWSGATFTPLAWYQAYNDVKHDREKNFSKATLSATVEAMAAIHVLVTAQFGSFGHFPVSDLQARGASAPRLRPPESSGDAPASKSRARRCSRSARRT